VVAQFCDLSQFQPQDIDWQAYKKWSAQGDGISRVAMRSSYGLGYVDTHFQTYREGALAAGIDMIIYYHYSYPQFNNAADEANWQKSVVGNLRTQDVLILDFEENVGEATSAWAYTWLAQQEANYGKAPGLYASTYYIQSRLQYDVRLARYPLWLANWQFTPDERPPVPAPWSSYEFVQYTDRATNIPGINATVDANIFLGGKPPMPPTPAQPTAYQLKEALDCWKSYFERTLGQPAPATGTGIYQAWVSDWVNRGRHYGPPITKEYDSNNWSGGHIICQEFAHARCEYSNGVSTWYTPNGKIQ